VAENELLVDFEGYFFQDNFYFKEFSFFDSAETIKTFYLKTPNKNFLNYDWLVSMHHKMRHNFGSSSHKIITEIINKPKIKIIVKGVEKVKILEKFTNNEIINLELLGCPAYKQITALSRTCFFHTLYPSVHCSQLKVSKLLSWLSENESRTSSLSTRVAENTRSA
jgi:hypothetical protein